MTMITPSLVPSSSTAIYLYRDIVIDNITGGMNARDPDKQTRRG